MENPISSPTTDQTQTLPVQATWTDGTHTTGQIQIRVFSKNTRMRRSLKIWAILWGLAIVSVLIPLAHFVLVPAFLLAGPVTAYFIYQTSETIETGHFDCPKCQKPAPIAPGKLVWPYRDLCPVCKNEATLSQR